jgi:hypothetical protein
MLYRLNVLLDAMIECCIGISLEEDYLHKLIDIIFQSSEQYYCIFQFSLHKSDSAIQSIYSSCSSCRTGSRLSCHATTFLASTMLQTQRPLREEPELAIATWGPCHIVSPRFFACPCLVHKKFQRFPVISNLVTHAWSIKCRRKQILITQFICNLQDESFEFS